MRPHTLIILTRLKYFALGIWIQQVIIASGQVVTIGVRAEYLLEVLELNAIRDKVLHYGFGGSHL